PSPVPGRAAGGGRSRARRRPARRPGRRAAGRADPEGPAGGPSPRHRPRGGGRRKTGSSVRVRFRRGPGRGCTPPEGPPPGPPPKRKKRKPPTGRLRRIAPSANATAIRRQAEPRAGGRGVGDTTVSNRKAVGAGPAGGATG